MREPPRILEERLRACLQDQYGLIPVTLEFLSLGHDYSAGVYSTVSEQGTAYLLKATSRPLYESRCLLPRYLYDQGITSVVAPIPTSSGALWTSVEEWTVIVYPFIDGDTSLTGMTGEQWKETGAILQRIHQVALPPSGFSSLRKETFDPATYAQWIQTFETRHLKPHTDEPGSLRTLRAAWIAHQSTIHTGIATLEKLATALKVRQLPCVICHADLHAANLLRDRHGHVFVIDWDEVMLAPRERDFIFIRSPQADAFWEGYGQREVDEMALTYYLWERVIQDVIEEVQSVFFRDDWAEETRAQVAQAFHTSLESGSNLKAAREASARLAIIPH
jgi:spectinomycin phosphotransferase